MRSRNLNILYEGNRKTNMCVETNFGRSSRVELGKVVMQGSVPGGMICSNQISKLCTKLYNEGDVYMYDDKIPIPALAMVDDIASIAECNSTQSLTTNIKTDTFIQRKKLEGQTGQGKCQWVHVGTDKCRSSYKINGKEITQAESYKYLGDHAADGWTPLYKKRWEKAQGYCAMCLAMCTEMTLGIQLYATAKLLHESIFVNGTLLNMETWPNCTNVRLEMFERTEQMFLRKILNAHSKTPIECLYLELGVVPLRFQLMKRRIMYLQTILQRPDGELTKQVVLCQKETCYKGDFYSQTKVDMEYLMINEENLLESSKDQLKNVLSKQIMKIAFDYLIEKAISHSKVHESVYTDLEGAKQFKDARFSNEVLNNLFRFRTRTFMVKNNFRNNYKNTNTLCPLCEKENDDQEHVFVCEKIVQQYGRHILNKYTDIFSDDIDTLFNVAIILKDLVDVREQLLSSDESQ